MKEIKCVIIGDEKTKTHKCALEDAFINKYFICEYDPTTEDEDSGRKVQQLDGESVSYDIYNTAGQEEYSAMRDQGMSAGDVIIICYNVTLKSTFNSVRGYYEQILRVKDADTYPMVLVGMLPQGGSDDGDERCVSSSEGKALADSLGMPFFEVSPRKRLNVNETFECAARIVFIRRLRNAILDNDFSTFQKYYKSIINKPLGPDKKTALHLAAAQGNVRMCQLLLKGEAKVNELDQQGNTPLGYAVKYGYLEIIKALLKSNAVITSLMKSLSLSQGPQVRELILGDIKQINCVLVGGGQSGRVNLGIELRCDASRDEFDPTIDTADKKIHLVNEEEILFNFSGLVSDSGEYSAMDDTSIRNGDVFVLCYDVTRRSSFEEIRVFYNKITADANLNSMILVGIHPQNDKDNEDNCSVSVVEGKYLAKSLGGIPFFEIQLPDKDDRLSQILEEVTRVFLETKVRNAILKNDLKTFEQHYKSVIDKPLGPDKKTALHLAAAQGNVQMCQLLLRAGASKDVLDGEGHTPSFFTESSQNKKLIQLFTEKKKAGKSSTSSMGMFGKRNGGSKKKVTSKPVEPSAPPMTVVPEPSAPPMTAVAQYPTISSLNPSAPPMTVTTSGKTQSSYAGVNTPVQHVVIDLKEIHYDLNEQDQPLVIGFGSSCVVYQATYAGMKVAVKRFEGGVYNQLEIQQFENECSMLLKLRHDNIVTFYGACFEPTSSSLVMELMPQQSLYDVLYTAKMNGKPLDWSLRIQIAADISRGLMYLHGQGVIHRDLKSPNILLNDAMQAKICDLGVSKAKSGQTLMTMTPQSAIGTVPWMAPEIMMLNPVYTSAVDVYALSIIFWELMSNEKPYGETPFEVIQTEVKKGKRLPITKECLEKYPFFAKLTEKCWHKNPKKRPSAEEVYNCLQTKLGMNK